MHRLLVVEGDSPSVAPSVGELLADDRAFIVEQIAWDTFSGVRARREPGELLVFVAGGDTDRVLRDIEGLERTPWHGPVLGVLPERPDERLVQALLEIAHDVIFLPIRVAELRHRVVRLLNDPERKLKAVQDRLRAEVGLTNLVGQSPVFLRAIEHLPRFARADISVLIAGETGTGKEVCARALHHLSPRRDCSFVVVDCGAIPESLFENELFGHVRGAFTGAERDQRGQVASADGGTLLLDEIDALSLSCQAKLLRFLQERTFRPLGSDRVQRADVKVLAASNQDLAASVKNRQFRSDLYFRLNVLRIELPPLRERRGDTELLAYNFLKDCSAWVESPPSSFSAAAMRALTLHDWPGNVRELGNVVQRAAVTCAGDRILPCDLELRGAAPADDATGPSGEFRAARAAVVADFERRYVEELLRKHNGNVTQAAREACQDRRAFGRFIKKYQIDRQEL